MAKHDILFAPLSRSAALTEATDLLAIACEQAPAGGDTAAPLPAALAPLDAALAGALSEAVRAERWKGKAGQIVSLATLGKLPARRIALIGVGASTPEANAITGHPTATATIPAAALRPFAGRAARLALAHSARSVVLASAAEALVAHSAQAAQALTEGTLLGAYRFDKYLGEERRTPAQLEKVGLAVATSAAAEPALTDAIARGRSTATATMRARDLINEPAVEMTPRKMAEVATTWGRENNLTVEILGPAECRAQQMGLFLAVAQGSAEEPRFIHLGWTPGGAKKRVVLIGKGVTFDSGGHSLKPSDGMLDMKTDMSGAAAVLSVIAQVAAEKLPLEVHALAACTENMLSGTAYRLGDVFRSKGGKTVEINNTDAEGRLTLADAIAFARQLKPDQMFDFATLTGACMVGLGPHVAGVMTNDDSLRQAWLAAARESGEEMWPLPLPERLLEQLKSEIADMKNTGERYGGALTAGLFLKEFVGETPWVHVDMAGPARSDKESGHVGKGGTGFAVATMLTYLRALAAE